MSHPRPAAVHFQLDPRLKAKLTAIAMAEGLSLSATVRLILRSWFEGDRARAGPRVSPLSKLEQRRGEQEPTAPA
jgi:hypothetical protein